MTLLGSRVTLKNVDLLPVGTIVRWTWKEPVENPACAVRTGPYEWHVSGQDGVVDDAWILVDEAPAFVAWVPAT